MIDNFNLIKTFLMDRFPSEECFYFLQLICRKKDNPLQSCSVRVIKTYYIYNLDYLDTKKDEIIKICTENNARAYINLNCRNNKNVAFAMLKQVADAIFNQQYKHIATLYDSCCGQTCSAKEKLWLIDIDNDDCDLVNKITTYVNSQKPETENKIKLIVPTVHGKHIFTTPFDRSKFGIEFPNIDLHKDNPTVLYCPDLK